MKAPGQNVTHHQQTNTQFFTGRMPFLPPNQQRQSRARYSLFRSVLRIMILYINECTYSRMYCIVESFSTFWLGQSFFFVFTRYKNSKRNSISGALNTRDGTFDQNRRLSRKRYEIGPWLL